MQANNYNPIAQYINTTLWIVNYLPYWFCVWKSEIEAELQNLISWKIFSTTGFIMKEEFYFANWNLNFQFQSKSAENWKSFPAPTLLQTCTGWDVEDNHEWKNMNGENMNCDLVILFRRVKSDKDTCRCIHTGTLGENKYSNMIPWWIVYMVHVHSP